jgi:hypothetical protein
MGNASGKEDKMWEVCLDSQSIQEGLSQTVIQYKIKENGEAVIILPETAYKPDIKYIKELPVPPQHKHRITRNYPIYPFFTCGLPLLVVLWNTKRHLKLSWRKSGNIY